jgi:hypothetical protein
VIPLFSDFQPELFHLFYCFVFLTDLVLSQDVCIQGTNRDTRDYMVFGLSSHL